MRKVMEVVAHASKLLVVGSSLPCFKSFPCASRARNSVCLETETETTSKVNESDRDHISGDFFLLKTSFLLQIVTESIRTFHQLV